MLGRIRCIRRTPESFGRRLLFGYGQAAAESGLKKIRENFTKKGVLLPASDWAGRGRVFQIQRSRNTGSEEKII